MRINLDTPYQHWSLMVSVRGTDLPILHPAKVAEISLDVVPEVEAARASIGVVRRLWRWAFGHTPRELPEDHELLRQRMVVRAATDPIYHGFVGQLSGAELCMVLAAVQGHQLAWHASMVREARQQAEAAQPKQAGVNAPSRPAQRPVNPSPGGNPPMAPLRGGEPLPGFMGGLAWGRAAVGMKDDAGGTPNGEASSG